MKSIPTPRSRWLPLGSSSGLNQTSRLSGEMGGTPAILIGVEITVPDFSTLSRWGKGLVLPPVRRPTASRGPVHLVVDSTGLKVW